MQHISGRNIILGGLSHGCAMSLSLLLCLDFSLAGYIGLSGWLPFQKDLMDILLQGQGQDSIDGEDEDEDNMFGATDGVDDSGNKDLIFDAF